MEVKQFFKNSSCSLEDIDVVAIKRTYEVEESLPIALIIDCLLYYGRKINRVIYDYENILLRALEVPQEAEDTFRDRLIYLTSTYVFAQFKKPMTNIFNRLQRTCRYKLELSEAEMYYLQAIIMNALNENVVDNDNQIDKGLIDLVDFAISEISMQTEAEMYKRYMYRSFIPRREYYMEWGVEYSLKDFIELCKKLCHSSIDIDVEVVKSMLTLREKQGYVFLSTDSSGQLIIRTSEQAELIRPFRYIEYILMLKEIYRRCVQSQLDLKKELQRMIDNFPSEIHCSFQELYNFLESLKKTGKSINDVDFNIIRTFGLNMEEKRLLFIVERRSDLLRMYRSI